MRLSASSSSDRFRLPSATIASRSVAPLSQAARITSLTRKDSEKEAALLVVPAGIERHRPLVVL
ncbi:uncharacterized protein METZ01_LOCUS493021, partial [marine metagenome]